MTIVINGINDFLNGNIEITRFNDVSLDNVADLLPKGHLGPCIIKNNGRKLIPTCQCITVSGDAVLMYSYEPALTDVRKNNINKVKDPFYNSFRTKRNKCGNKRW